MYQRKKIQKFIEGKVYKLFDSESFYPEGRNEHEYEVLYKNGKFQLLQYGLPMFEDFYSTLKVLARTIENESHSGCLVFLSKDGEKGQILDVVKEKWVTNEMNFSSVKIVHHIEENRCPTFGEPTPEINIIEILDKRNHEVTLYSTDKGIILGPIKYKHLELEEFGYIIDEHFLYEFNGFQKDLTGYEYRCCSEGYEVLYNEENDEYILISYHQDGGYFSCWDEEESCDEYLYMEIDDNIIKFYKETNELRVSQKWDGTWTADDYRDAYMSAFEDDPSALWNVDDQ